MTRAMAHNWNTDDGMVWDFVYPAFVFCLGFAATAAVVIQIGGI